LKRLTGKGELGVLSCIQWSRQISHAIARREKTLWISLRAGLRACEGRL